MALTMNMGAREAELLLRAALLDDASNVAERIAALRAEINVDDDGEAWISLDMDLWPEDKISQEAEAIAKMLWLEVDWSSTSGTFPFAWPVLYYGLLTSKTNLDVTAEPLLNALRAKLNAERLHANELGVARLSEIATDLDSFALKRHVRFSLYKVAKPDHAIITFFDQVFDAGLNEAVPWHHYRTPLRYVLIFKVAYLFDEETAKAA